MTILEFMEVFHRCQVSARLCVGAIELDYDYIAELPADNYEAYQKFVRSLTPYWIAAIHKVAPVIDVEIVWASFSGDEWKELLEYRPDWRNLRETHYRAPKFFAGF